MANYNPSITQYTPGNNYSSTGSSFGGIIGGVTGGPTGMAIGNVIGGLVGSLFSSDAEPMDPYPVIIAPRQANINEVKEAYETVFGSGSGDNVDPAWVDWLNEGRTKEQLEVLLINQYGGKLRVDNVNVDLKDKEYIKQPGEQVMQTSAGTAIYKDGNWSFQETPEGKAQRLHDEEYIIKNQDYFDKTEVEWATNRAAASTQWANEAAETGGEALTKSLQNRGLSGQVDTGNSLLKNELDKSFYTRANILENAEKIKNQNILNSLTNNLANQTAVGNNLLGAAQSEAANRASANYNANTNAMKLDLNQQMKDADYNYDNLINNYNNALASGVNVNNNTLAGYGSDNANKAAIANLASTAFNLWMNNKTPDTTSSYTPTTLNYGTNSLNNVNNYGFDATKDYNFNDLAYQNYINNERWYQ